MKFKLIRQTKLSTSSIQPHFVFLHQVQTILNKLIYHKIHIYKIYNTLRYHSIFFETNETRNTINHAHASI